MKFFRKWVQAVLLMIIAVGIVCGFALDGEQRALSEKLIRLHVVAASDSEEDQHTKLAVRDRILEELADCLDGVSDRDEALEILSHSLPRLKTAARETLYANGTDDSVEISLQREDFPTRDYGSFALPAGEYMSLRVTIGGGEGKNWWCVVFPPICSETAIRTDVTVSLSENEQKLIYGETGDYVLKFKAIELVEKIKAKLF